MACSCKYVIKNPIRRKKRAIFFIFIFLLLILLNAVQSIKKTVSISREICNLDQLKNEKHKHKIKYKFVNFLFHSYTFFFSFSFSNLFDYSHTSKTKKKIIILSLFQLTSAKTITHLNINTHADDNNNKNSNKQIITHTIAMISFWMSPPENRRILWKQEHFAFLLNKAELFHHQNKNNLETETVAMHLTHSKD